MVPFLSVRVLLNKTSFYFILEVSVLVGEGIIHSYRTHSRLFLSISSLSPSLRTLKSITKAKEFTLQEKQEPKSLNVSNPQGFSYPSAE